MARNAKRGLSGWFEPGLASFSGSALPAPDGSLSLVAANQIEDSSFSRLTPDGGAEDLQIPPVPSLDGYHVYVSPPGGGRAKLGRQNGTPFGPETVSWVANQPVIPGPRPRLSAGGELQQPAPDFTVKKITVTNNVGYAGGTYLAAVSATTFAGSHTTLSEPVAFTIANGQGIEFILPDPAEGQQGFGLWLSRPVPAGGTPDPATLRLQRVISRRHSTFRLYGPYRYGRRAPSRNETYVGRAATPRLGRDVRRGRAVGELQPMTFSVAIVEVTPRGDSIASERTPQVVVPPTTRTVTVRRRLREGEEPREGEELLRAPDGTRYAVRSETREAGHPHQAYWIEPKKHHPDATHFKTFVYKDGTWYQLIDKTAVMRGYGHRFGTPIPLYGYVQGKEPAGIPFVLVQADPPFEEDSSGIEAPAGQIDPPVGIGASRPPAGTYTVTYAPVIGGREQRAAEPRRVTIAQNQKFQIVFPPIANRLANAEGGELEADGRPPGWTFDLGPDNSYGFAYVGDGRVGVSTAGAVLDTTRDAPYAETEPVAPTSHVQTLRGVLEVANFIAGEGQAVLRQYDRNGAFIAFSYLARLAANGAVPFRKTVGPAGSGADIEFVEGCASIAVRVLCSGQQGRNLSARLYDLALHPFRGAPRKLLAPPPGQEEAANPNPPRSVPYPSGALAAIAPPPPSPARPGSRAPIERAAFEGGTFPAGWSVTRSPQNQNVIAEVSSISPISGGYSAHFQSAAINVSTQSYIAKTYSPSQTASGRYLAVRARVRFDALPSSGVVNFLGLRTPQNRWLAFARVDSGGRLYLNIQDGQGRYLNAYAGRLRVGEVWDLEVQVRGVGTSSASAALYGGAGGSPRELLASFDDIDWSGLEARNVVAGTVYEQDPSGTWDYRLDDLAVTLYGDVDAEGSPQSVDTPTPDRPVRLAAPLESGSGDRASASAALSGRASGWLLVSGTLAPFGTSGYTVASLGAGQGTPLARADVSSSGQVSLVYPGGSRQSSLTLSAGQQVTLELGIQNLGPSANLYLYYRPRGADIYTRRLVAFASGVDLSAYAALDYVRVVGASFSDTPAWALYAEGEGVFREIDDVGEQINQLYVFIPPGWEKRGVGAHITERVVVPGQTYTFAVYGRKEKYGGGADPWRVTLYSEEGAAVRALEVSSSSEQWSEWSGAFTVPDGYQRAVIGFYPEGAGMWIFQEPLLARGSLSTGSQRDAARSHARSTGTFSAVIPSGIPSPRRDALPVQVERRIALDVAAEVPSGSSLSASWAWAQEPAGPWTPAASAAEVPREARWLRCEGTLTPTPDGLRGPRIAAGGISEEYRTTLPVLLRQDGTSLPGGSVVVGLSRPYRRPDYLTDPVGGHARPVPTTEEIDRLEAFTVYLFSTEAVTEFREKMLREDWLIDYPAAEAQVRVRLYEAAEGEAFEPELLEELTGHIWTAFSVSRAEVIERAALDATISIEEG